LQFFNLACSNTGKPFLDNFIRRAHYVLTVCIHTPFTLSMPWLEIYVCVCVTRGGLLVSGQRNLNSQKRQTPYEQTVQGHLGL